MTSLIRKLRSFSDGCIFSLFGPTLDHLRLEACLLASLSLLTLGYMNNLHEEISLQDLKVHFIFTLFLSRHLLFRIFCFWDPATSRFPRNFITVFIQSHILKGTCWDRTCKEIPSRAYQWTDIIPSTDLYLYQVLQVYFVHPLSRFCKPIASKWARKPVDGSSRLFFWRQRIYSFWFQFISPWISVEWVLGLILTVDALSIWRATYGKSRHGRDLSQLVILTGTALHRLDDVVVHTPQVSLSRKYYMAGIISSVLTRSRVINTPPDMYKTPSLYGATLYIVGRWLELMLMFDMLPVQSCRGTGFCKQHCDLASTGYADFRRDDCDDPDVFFSWSFLIVSGTILLVGTLFAQCLAHSYTVWKDLMVRGKEEWKVVDTALSIPDWKDAVGWDFCLGKERYNRGDRVFQIWSRRTYEAKKATTRPPPSFFVNGLDSTTSKAAWLVPLAQIQWMLAAFYLMLWLVRFLFFGIYSAWVYGLYALVAHCIVAYAVSFPAPNLKSLAQEINERPKTYRF